MRFGGARSQRNHQTFFARDDNGSANRIGVPLHEEQAVSELGPFRAKLALAPDASTIPGPTRRQQRARSASSQSSGTTR